MAEVPQVSGAKAVAAFKRAGFLVLRTKGSHTILGKPGISFRLSIPSHGNKPVGRGLLARQIKLSGMTLEEFKNLL